MDNTFGAQFRDAKDHNLLNPGLSAIPNFRGSATKLLRNIFSCWRLEWVNFPNGSPSLGAHHSEATILLRGRNSI